MSTVKPLKRLGQNFLNNPRIIEKIVERAGINLSDLVVEIGPGLGTLTEALALRAKRVVALELDDRLIPVLEKKFALGKAVQKNIKIVHADALSFTPPKEPYKIVANLPYYIGSPLLAHFIKEQFEKNGNPPISMTVMLQKEVAEKLCAMPPDMNVLALNVQPFGKPTYAFTVKKSAFSPQPKIDSAVAHIEIYEKPLIENFDLFFELVSAGFSQKRKTLWNALAKLFPDRDRRTRLFEKAKIDPKRRAETLSIEEWNRLTSG